MTIFNTFDKPLDLGLEAANRHNVTIADGDTIPYAQIEYPLVVHTSDDHVLLRSLQHEQDFSDSGIFVLPSCIPLLRDRMRGNNHYSVIANSIVSLLTANSQNRPQFVAEHLGLSKSFKARRDKNGMSERVSRMMIPMHVRVEACHYDERLTPDPYMMERYGRLTWKNLGDALREARDQKQRTSKKNALLTETSEILGVVMAKQMEIK